jgi:predicted transcriptional regulator
MKKATVTIRLDAKLQQTLDAMSVRLGRSRSDIVRDALRRHLSLVRLEQVRREALSPAADRGFLTDEDVFAAVS